MKLFKTYALAGLAYASTTLAASAQTYSWWDSWYYSWTGGSTSTDGDQVASAVPEIDASTGLLAVAAVLATLALSWEIKRRRAS
jgi:hypothetical protein